MTKLPRGLSGHEVMKVLLKADFYKDHQVGSHVTLRHKDDPSRKAVIPLHKGKEVAPKTLKIILNGAGLTVEEFTGLL